MRFQQSAVVVLLLLLSILSLATAADETATTEAETSTAAEDAVPEMEDIVGIESTSISSNNMTEEELVEFCQTDVRWKGEMREKCTAAMNWTPRSRLWQPFLDGRLPMKDKKGVDQKEAVSKCLDDALEAHRLLRRMNIIEPKALNKKKKSKKKKPKVSYMHEAAHMEDEILLVEIENAIDEDKAFAVKSLAGCLREHLNKIMYEFRPFPNNVGGNDCTYVSVFLPMFLPGVASHVQTIGEMGWKAANWGGDLLKLPPVGTLGIRTSEHLSYGNFKKGVGGHQDEDSIYTVIFALTNPEQYGGGEFFIEDGEDDEDEDADQVKFKAKQYGAFVFLSETTHGVVPITYGHREMFTNEYWPLEDAPYPENRAYADHVEAFGWKVDANNGDSSNVTWVTEKETNELFAERGRKTREAIEEEEEEAEAAAAEEEDEVDDEMDDEDDEDDYDEDDEDEEDGYGDEL